MTMVMIMTMTMKAILRPPSFQCFAVKPNRDPPTDQTRTEQHLIQDYRLLKKQHIITYYFDLIRYEEETTAHLKTFLGTKTISEFCQKLRNHGVDIFLLDNDDDGGDDDGDDDGGGDDNDVDIFFARQHHQELPLQN